MQWMEYNLSLPIRARTLLRHEPKNLILVLKITNQAAYMGRINNTSGESTSTTLNNFGNDTTGNVVGLAIGVTVPVLVALSGALLCFYRKQSKARVPNLVLDNVRSEAGGRAIGGGAGEAGGVGIAIGETGALEPSTGAPRPKLVSGQTNTNSITTTANKTAVVNSKKGS
jgi:hypothetical protein